MGLPGGRVRLPLVDATDAQISQLREDLKQSGETQLMNHPHPELGLPPRLPAKTLRIVALGGLAEVGRNMTVFEYDGELLVVDCGDTCSSLSGGYRN